jgi:hypothetical protein
VSDYDDDVPDGYVPVPWGSGWFGFSSKPTSVTRYGITYDEYHALLANQDGNCAICKRHQTSVGPLVVDHDHNSRRVRGLVCHACNLGLGKFNDDPYLLGWARDYLFERGCAATEPLDPETEASIAPYVESPEQRARRLSALPRRTCTVELAYNAARGEPGLGREGETFRVFGKRWEVVECHEERLVCREVGYDYEPERGNPRTT